MADNRFDPDMIVRETDVLDFDPIEQLQQSLDMVASSTTPVPDPQIDPLTLKPKSSFRLGY